MPQDPLREALERIKASDERTGLVIVDVDRALATLLAALPRQDEPDGLPAFMARNRDAVHGHDEWVPTEPQPPIDEDGSHQHEFKCLTCDAAFPRGHRFPSEIDPPPRQDEPGLRREDVQLLANAIWRLAGD